jgi:hypothetical protein
VDIIKMGFKGISCADVNSIWLGMWSFEWINQSIDESISGSMNEWINGICLNHQISKFITMYNQPNANCTPAIIQFCKVASTCFEPWRPVIRKLVVKVQALWHNVYPHV